MCIKEQNVLSEWPCWIWPKAHLLRIQFPRVASSLGRGERPGQAHSEVILALSTLLLTWGDEKSSPCPQVENTTTIKMNKSKKKKSLGVCFIDCPAEVQWILLRSLVHFFKLGKLRKTENINKKAQHYDNIFFPYIWAFFFLLDTTREEALFQN